ncbi:hypothetical protein N665_0452s0040 [Sinapis alba]|nr:hypothetical protein N665_0452s0040 [Sinapis alba]
MEPTSIIDDAEFRLPPEFLTDDDFLVELSHGFGLDSGFSSTVKPACSDEEESFLTGLTRKTVRSTLEDDFSGGFCGNHAFPSSKACGPLREGGNGFGGRNQNQAAAWDLYCAALEELAMMNINDGSYGYNSGRGVFDLPKKHPLAVAEVPNGGFGYYSRQSLQYQKLQALQFQQLKQQQQQLMKQVVQQSRGLRANNKKVAGHVDLSPSAWYNQPQRRDGSGMRAVFLGDRTGKPRSTGTGVFLPRRVHHTLETREKPSLATVLVPARVAEALNLDESVVQPSVRSSASLINDMSWRQRSNSGGFSRQMKMEQTVNEPRLPSDWAY